MGDGGGEDPGGGDRPDRGRVDLVVAGQRDGLVEGGEDVVGKSDRGVGPRGSGER